MGKKAKEETKLNLKSLLLTICGGLFGIYLLLIFSEALFFSDRFGPFARIANVPVGNMDKKTAIEKVDLAWKDYAKQSIKIDSNSLKPSDITVSEDAEKAVSRGLDLQKQGYLVLDIFSKRNTSLYIKLNDKEIDKIINDRSKEVSRPAINANIILGDNVQITDAKDGQELQLPESKQNILDGIANLNKDIKLRVAVTKPKITKTQAEGLVEIAKTAISDDIKIKTPVGDSVIPKETLANWEKLDVNSLGKVTYFDNDKVNAWVNDLAAKIDRNAVNAKLAVTDGRATVFVPEQTGYELDKNDANTKVQSAAEGSREVTPNVKVTQPEVTADSLNNLGIKELISTGWTDFSGSPANRIHNFTTGASKFNGVLIKPDEVFSFNKTLGAVDASTGYLPELVIVENKTTPQFGGGLCQVSSTAFRAALNAGLPIIERLNHAYPVVYYKPYGVDATIYLPQPDLQFKNDTGHYILIQTRIEGNRLYFDFYGTKVNRTVKFSGNPDANGAVNVVENVTPYIYDQGVRGKNSFTAVFYRHIYDATGKLTDNDKFTSKYDSPDKYPH